MWAAKLELFGRHDHLTSGRENRIIALRLPEFDVEFPVREFASNNPGFPGWVRLAFRIVLNCRGPAEKLSKESAAENAAVFLRPSAISAARR